MLPNGARRCGAGDDVMSILGLLAAPRPLFSGLCSLFPWLAFPRGGLTALVLAGARARPGGEGRRGRARGRPLCVPGKALRHRRAAGPRPGPPGSQLSCTPGAESGGENREEDGEEKLNKQVLPSLGLPPKCARVANFLGSAFLLPKDRSCPASPSLYPSLGGSCCQPSVSSCLLGESILQTTQKV